MLLPFPFFLVGHKPNHVFLDLQANTEKFLHPRIQQLDRPLHRCLAGAHQPEIIHIGGVGFDVGNELTPASLAAASHIPQSKTHCVVEKPCVEIPANDKVPSRCIRGQCPQHGQNPDCGRNILFQQSNDHGIHQGAIGFRHIGFLTYRDAQTCLADVPLCLFQQTSLSASRNTSTLRGKNTSMEQRFQPQLDEVA